jgi:hypothetical protein
MGTEISKDPAPPAQTPRPLGSLPPPPPAPRSMARCGAKGAEGQRDSSGDRKLVSWLRSRLPRDQGDKQSSAGGGLCCRLPNSWERPSRSQQPLHIRVTGHPQRAPFLAVGCPAVPHLLLWSVVPFPNDQRNMESHSARQNEKFYFCRRAQPQTRA